MASMSKEWMAKLSGAPKSLASASTSRLGEARSLRRISSQPSLSQPNVASGYSSLSLQGIVQLSLSWVNYARAGISVAHATCAKLRWARVRKALSASAPTIPSLQQRLPISCLWNGDFGLEGGSSTWAQDGLMRSAMEAAVREVPTRSSESLKQGVSEECYAAMQRTITGMLGMLPSDEFSVAVGSGQNTLAKLLRSAVMTGYALLNAEFRLELRRNFEMLPALGGSSAGVVGFEQESEDEEMLRLGMSGMEAEEGAMSRSSHGHVAMGRSASWAGLPTGDMTPSCSSSSPSHHHQHHHQHHHHEQHSVEEWEREKQVGGGNRTQMGHRGASVAAGAAAGPTGGSARRSGEVSGLTEEQRAKLDPAVAQYVAMLEKKVAAMGKDLNECHESLAALEMELIRLETKGNRILNYVQDLSAEQLANLSKPSSRHVEFAAAALVDSVLRADVLQQTHGAFAKDQMATLDPQYPLPTTPNVFSSRRDKVAHLLLWCMLAGHHIRSLENRLQLDSMYFNGDSA